ncbi:hypothetical protein [Pedobacter westerhofensis]
MSCFCSVPDGGGGNLLSLVVLSGASATTLGSQCEGQFDPKQRGTFAEIRTRFNKQFNGHNFFEILKDNELWRLLLFWKDVDPSGLEDKIIEELDRHQNAALILLKTFIPTIIRTSGADTVIFKSGMNLKGYQSIAGILDPNLIYDKLLESHGLLKLELEPEKSGDRLPLNDQETIYLFQQLHLKDTSERLETDAPVDPI